MKKILLLLCILIGQISFSQEENSLVMSDEIVPIVEEFIKDGQDRGFYLRFYLMDKINSIVFSSNLTLYGEDLLGLTDKYSRSIYISEDLKFNRLLLKLTIYHEIGHLIKYENRHSCIKCYDIMSEYAIQDLTPYTDNKFWNTKVDEYFIWLNNK